MLSQNELKRLLHYDEFTGKFRWKVKRQCVKEGDNAGSIQKRRF